MLQAGSLRESISIEAPAPTQDGFGQVTPTWTPVYQCRASVLPMRSRDLYANGAGRTGEVTYKVTIRYTSTVSITSAMRVVWGSKVLVIESPPVDPDGRRRELHITALLEDK